MHQSVVEIGTGVCKNIQEAKEEIRDIRRQIVTLARENGLRLAAGGTHPFAEWREQEIYPDERYHVIVEDLKMVARANLIFGLHVHIGVEDRETAHSAHEQRALFPAAPAGALRQLAVLAGHGHGAALLPLQGVRQVSAHQHSRTSTRAGAKFENYVNLLIHTNCIDNAKKIWWDIRPHPHFPTLEFRVCDMPMRAGRDASPSRRCARRSSPSCTSCTSRT